MAEIIDAPITDAPFDLGFQTADEPDIAFGERDDDDIETPDDGEPDADD